MKSHLGLICLIVLSTMSSEKALTVIPDITTALIGDSTYFNCSTTSETVEWLFISDGNLHQSVIYSYGSVKPLYQDRRFRVEKYTNSIEKQFNLILQSLTKDDPGRYICRDPDSRNEEGEAQLIVLEAEPVCESNLNVDELIGPNSCAVKPDTVQLSCSVRYIGSQFPEMQWIKTDENIAINSSICSASGNINTCNLTMESELHLEGSSYVCQTTQSRTRKYNCTSDVFRIMYVLSQQKQLNKTEGDTVTCSIKSSSLLCNYTWKYYTEIDSRIESHNRTIELNRPGHFACEVNCTIRNASCNTTPLTVIVLSQDDSKTSSTMVGGVVCLCLIICFLCIGLFIWRMIRRRNKRKLKSYGQDALETEVQHLDTENEEEMVDGLQASFSGKITSMTTENKEKKVKGLTILDEKLYIVFRKSNIIEVFEIEFHQPVDTVTVKNLMNPGTTAACKINGCLYIMDQKDDYTAKEIFRVNRDGTATSWKTKDDIKGRISVNIKGNIIVSVYYKNIVRIYSPNGTLEKTIDLSKTDIQDVFHAIGLTDGNFIVSHGIHSSPLHRVCKLDDATNVLQSFGSKKGLDNAHLNSPAYLAERNDGSILVADQFNHRIILLSCKLKLVEELFTKAHRIRYPETMYVYDTEKSASLYLGCNNEPKCGGYVLVLPLASTEHHSRDHE